MSNYNKYVKCLERSVIHIFTTFLKDENITDTVESHTNKDDFKVWIEINGTFEGEIEIRFPEKTIHNISKYFLPKQKGLKACYTDIAGELANQITGTLANQLQYINHKIHLSPPEFEEDPIQMKTLYENICLSFHTSFGGFDIETFFKDRLF